MENGVLTISIPKSDSRQRAQRIQVRSGSGESGDGRGGASSGDGGSANESGSAGGQTPHH
jgi:hypothetical protein